MVDIAGLVRGASQGEGLGNQFLSHVRAVDALAMVVRCFEDASVPHVTADLRPVQDMDVIALEMALSDLDMAERHLERVRTRARPTPANTPTRSRSPRWSSTRYGQDTRYDPSTWIRRSARCSPRCTFLTAKPILYVANVSEGNLPAGGPLGRSRSHARGGRGRAHHRDLRGAGGGANEFAPEEAAAYLAEVGLSEPGLPRLVQAGYRYWTISPSSPSRGAKRCAHGHCAAARRYTRLPGRSTRTCSAALSGGGASLGGSHRRRLARPRP